MDKEENAQISLTLPNDWIKSLEALKSVYGALNIQEVIRAILASALHKKES